MYIMINGIMGKKRIDLTYLIKNFNSNKEVAVSGLLSDNNQCEFTEPSMSELEELRIKQIMNLQKARID